MHSPSKAYAWRPISRVNAQKNRGQMIKIINADGMDAERMAAHDERIPQRKNAASQRVAEKHHRVVDAVDGVSPEGKKHAPR